MSDSTGRFARHYLEMVVAMFVGMPIFGILFHSPLDPLGLRETMFQRPFLSESLMLVTMSIPMAAYMTYRGHRGLRTAEMVAGMVIPSLVVIGLTAAAAVPFLTIASLSLWSHLAMLVGMLVAMLLRRDEYSMDHSQHQTHEGATH